MKGCELCPGTARMYCESDQATLCFDCDAKVHGANFLVARHSRSLLCRSCQAPTPWKAAGPRLGPTVSVCDRCVAGRSTIAVTRKKTPGDGGGEGESGVRERVEEEDNGDDDEDDGEEEEVEDEDDDDDEREEDQESEEEDEEEGEEQVVPWTADPPPVSSSSSSEESMGRIGNGLLKRMRGDNNVDLPPFSCSQDRLPCSSSPRPNYLPNRTALPNPVRTMEDDEGTSNSFRPLKVCKKVNLVRSGSHQLVSFGSGRPPI